MALPYPSNQFGVYVPTTFDLDVQSIYETEVDSPEFKELLVRLYQNLNKMALSLNVKETGQYPLSLFVPGQQWFSNPSLNSSTPQTPALRQPYRLVINLGQNLPNSGSVSVNHGITITSATTFTRIYATSSDTTNKAYIPIPSVNATISVNSTQVTITTTSNLSTYNVTYIVLEFLQN